MKPHFVISVESSTQGTDRWARRVNLHLQDDIGAGVCCESSIGKVSATSQYTLIFLAVQILNFKTYLLWFLKAKFPRN